MKRITAFLTRIFFTAACVGFVWITFFLYVLGAQMRSRVEYIELQNALIIAASCQDINMRSRQPQQLSYDECVRYFDETLTAMHKEPTATPLERDTSRPGLNILRTPSPTPCDPHTTLCTHISGR